MNVYKFEFKNLIKGTIIWIACIVLVQIAFLKFFFPLFTESMEEIKNMMAGMPPAFLESFGFNPETIFSAGGFFGFTFGYVGPLGAIMSVGIALAVFSREKRTKCSDFIFTRPIERGRLFFEKFIACLLMIILLNVVYILSGYLLSRERGMSFLLSNLSLLFTQILFLGIGMLVSVTLKKIRSVSGVATSIGIAAFALSAIVNLLEKEILLFLAPLKYFDPGRVYYFGGYDWELVIAAILIFVFCIVYSYMKYTKEDVPAV